MIAVTVRTDGSEQVKYNYDGYYAYINRALLSHYPNYAADSHWHDDLELIYVLSGIMQYNVNGTIITLAKGNGIFVNARQMHYGFSYEKEECDFICILLHPMLLCTAQYIDREFVSPILSDSAMPYLFLDGAVPWQRQVLADIEAIYHCKEKSTAPLWIQTFFYHIWILFTENALRERQGRKQDRNLAVLKDMLSYLQNNYAAPITLDSIAKFGNVSRSTCLVLFKKYLQDTPVNYLIGYRLKQAAGMLTETDLSIAEIALETGFQGASYFAETFKRKYNCSPGQYRRKHGGNSTLPNSVHLC